MKSSVRTTLPYALHRAAVQIRLTCHTAVSRLAAYWWSISLGRGVLFFGRPHLQRHPTAKITIGKNCVFRSAEWSNSIGLNRKCFIAAGRDAVIKIGDNCGFSGTIIAASRSIIIGSRVLCGGNCTIVDTDRHSLDFVERENNIKAKAIPTVIEDDVFLGLNVVVLKGCTIGRGTVVGANSLVATSLPGGVLAGGVPARVIREL